MNKSLRYTLTRRAGKELKRIRNTDRRLFEKFEEAINEIRLDPYCGEAKRGDLKGFYSVDIYHQNANYELCYKVVEDEQGNLIVIVLLGPRENFYNQLKRYLDM